MGKDEITFADFEKLYLRVGEIVDAEEIEGADKLWKLRVDLGAPRGVPRDISDEISTRGKENIITLCAGIKEHYSAEELIGKKIIVVANLAPRKMKGIESQGMLLAASNEDHSEIKLIEPEGEIGWSVG